MQHYAETMWAALLRRSTSSPTVKSLFFIWKHTFYFNKLHLAAKERGKLLRKQRLNSLLEQARRAAQDKDFREHHKLINQLAPKASYKKFQLLLNGQLLSPQAELDEMRKHFHRLHQADAATSSLAEATRPDAVPVSAPEVLLSVTKAGLPWHIPNKRSGDCAAIRSPPSYSRGFDGQMAIRQCQRASKMGARQPCTPAKARQADHRPRAVQAHRVDRRGRQKAAITFCLHRRSRTQEALRLVFHHCHLWTQAQHAQPAPAQAGNACLPLAGGLQACLDLSAAFDVVPRTGLLEALFEAGVPESPAIILLHWIARSTYRIQVEGYSADILSSRGVKQGCPASPLLFAASTTMLSRKLDARLDRCWSRDHLTLYADDWHISGRLITSYRSLGRMCQCLGVVMSLLQQHGMPPRPEPCARVWHTQAAVHALRRLWF